MDSPVVSNEKTARAPITYAALTKSMNTLRFSGEVRILNFRKTSRWRASKPEAYRQLLTTSLLAIGEPLSNKVSLVFVRSGLKEPEILIRPSLFFSFFCWKEYLAFRNHTP